MFEVLSFPPGPAGQALIVDAMMQMCATEEQLKWLVKRTVALHRDWKTCGIAGLRQILCSKYPPKDGVSCTSTVAFLDGVPAEKRIQDPPLPALPPGSVARMDTELDESFREVLGLRDGMPKRDELPPLSPEAQLKWVAFEKTLESVITAPVDRPDPVPQKPPTEIRWTEIQDHALKEAAHILNNPDATEEQKRTAEKLLKICTKLQL